jgi:hypothetical protein
MDLINVFNRIADEGCVAILVLVIVLTVYATYYHVEIRILWFIYIAILVSILLFSLIAIALAQTGQLKDICYFYRHRRIITIMLLISIATTVYAAAEGSTSAYIAAGFNTWALFLWGLFNIGRMLTD